MYRPTHPIPSHPSHQTRDFVPRFQVWITGPRREIVGTGKAWAQYVQDQPVSGIMSRFLIFWNASLSTIFTLNFYKRKTRTIRAAAPPAIVRTWSKLLSHSFGRLRRHQLVIKTSSQILLKKMRGRSILQKKSLYKKKYENLRFSL